MRLFVFCDENRPVIPGMLSDVDVCEQADISQKPDYFYSKIEAYGFLETCIHEDCLQQLMNKVGKNGTLKIQGIDAYQVVNNMVKGEITSEQFSSLMVKNKARCVSLHELATKINESQEFQIQYAGLSGLSYILEARKI
jgi:hypothetical protein|tara:strand:+ start:297 stop:713 length:417 start_codon:yes stop_codon:yes gene_type:complete